MAIGERIQSAVRSLLWPRYGGQGYSRLRFLLPGSRFDWEREGGDPWMNSVVALSLAWLGDRLPRPRLKVCTVARDGSVNEIQHGLVDLWTRPNPYYGRRSLEKAVGLSLKVDGNAYILKVRDNAQRVAELWWVPHFRIAPTWPSDGSAYIDGYMLQVDGRQQTIAPRDVIHIRDGIDPRNERLGLAALKASLRELCTDNYASSYAGGLLKNSGVPAVAMVPEIGGRAATSRDEAERMADIWTDRLSGDNVGRPVVYQGNYRIEQVGYSPENLVLDKLPQPAQARLAAAIGVAAMSLGLPDPNKTYSNLAEANRTSWGTIVSLQELIAETVGADLLRESIQVEGKVTPPVARLSDYRLEYDYSQIQELQESLNELSARVVNLYTNDVITKNEARDELGLEDVPDGDQFFSEAKAALAPEPMMGADEPAEASALLNPGKKSWRY